MGFSASGYIPYLAVVTVFFFILELRFALTAAVTALVVITGIVPWFDRILSAPVYPAVVLTLETRFSLAVAMVLLYYVSIRYQTTRRDEQEARKELLELRRLNLRQDSDLQALERALRELYNRSITQTTSISVLYEQVDRMYSVNYDEVTGAILESVSYLSGATACALYIFNDSSLRLELQASLGVAGNESGGEFTETLDTSKSIEGWVVRNNRVFSLRMLLKEESLRPLAGNRTVIAVPIHAHGRIWGVLTIREIPVLRYNEFAEKAIQLIAALAGPALEHAVSSVFGDSDTPEPGTPAGAENQQLRPVDVLEPFLARETRIAAETNHNVSVFLFEIRNAPAIIAQVGPVGLQELLEQIASMLSALSRSTAVLFEFHEPHQFCAAISTLDYDAASYFLLRMLESISSRAWSAGGELLFPDVNVGFASTNQVGFDPEKLLKKAEQVLVAQRGPER